MSAARPTGDAAAGPRVMHVVLSLAPGGAERLVIDLSRGLAPAVHSSICCLDEAGLWADTARQAGIPVDVIGRRPGLRPSVGLKIAALATKRRADVIHCHQYSPFVYGAIAGLRRPGLRVVFTEHGRLSDAPPTAKRRWVNRVLGRRPNVIVAVSDELRGHMIAEGFPESAVTVIHNGIDAGAEVTPELRTSARIILEAPEGALVVGTVARLDPVKRLDVLVSAFAGVHARIPASRLVIVGDGPERLRLEGLAAALGVSPAVRFTGMRDDARVLTQGFDVFVNTSASEGVSLTILEAMAASRPVVATRVGGTSEVVTDGQTGVLVPSGQPDAVTDAIIGLWHNPDRRRALGHAARAAVVARFSFERMSRAYLSAYAGRRGDN